MVFEAEHGFASSVRVHFYIRRPPGFDAFLGSDRAIDFLRRRGDLDSMNDVLGHVLLNTTMRESRNPEINWDTPQPCYRLLAYYALHEQPIGAGVGEVESGS